MKSKPRVLLLPAPSGAGHVRAAQALEKALSARGDCNVEYIDTIRYVSKLFQGLYDKTYLAMVRPNAAAEIAEDALALVN